MLEVESQTSGIRGQHSITMKVSVTGTRQVIAEADLGAALAYSGTHFFHFSVHVVHSQRTASSC